MNFTGPAKLVGARRSVGLGAICRACQKPDRKGGQFGAEEGWIEANESSLTVGVLTLFSTPRSYKNRFPPPGEGRQLWRRFSSLSDRLSQPCLVHFRHLPP